jgi:hypothetical protein
MKAECVTTIEENIYLQNFGKGRLVMSIEAKQDMQATWGCRNRELSDQEIAEWQEAWQEIKTWDIQKIKRKYNVRIWSENVPYQDYDD